MAHEVTGDGRTVWVNSDEDGGCIARFGVGGIDIHRATAEQMDGAGQCLFCTHERPKLAQWDRFRTEVLRLHGVAVSENLKPTWVRA